MGGLATLVAIYAIVCLGAAWLHRKIFPDTGDRSGSGNTLFDFVSTLGG